MKVLVTGSSGHLGEALVRTLTERGFDVLGLDIKKSAFTSVVASVDDSETVAKCMQGVHVQGRPGLAAKIRFRPYPGVFENGRLSKQFYFSTGRFQGLPRQGV